MYTLISVDDERYFHAGLDRLIDWQEHGFIRIGEAFDGESALDLIRKSRPSLVITDIRMPGIDGLELIARTSEIPDYQPDWIILSAYDNFSYAQKAMRHGVQHYLLKPVDESELREILNRVASSRRGQSNRPLSEDPEHAQLIIGSLIRRLVQGQPGNALCQSARETLGMEGPLRFVQALFPKSDHPDPETLFRELLSKAFPKQQPPLFCSFGSLSFGFLIPGGLSTADIEDNLQRLHFHCTQASGGELYFSVGNLVPGLAELHESYHSAQFAMNKNILCFKVPSVLADQLEPLEEVQDYDAARDMLFVDGLLEDIEAGDSEGVQEHLTRLFDRMRKKQVGQGVLKIWVNSLFIDVARLILELDGKIDEELRLFYHRSNNDPGFFIGDFFEEVSAFCLHASGKIQDLKRMNRAGVIMVICDYLQANYRKQISLKSLGEQFSMNPAYLGRLFKETLGKPFKRYLAELRIAEAKKLLTRTDLKVYEVAASVGYSDCDYFAEQFTKITGESPGSLRYAKT